MSRCAILLPRGWRNRCGCARRRGCRLYAGKHRGNQPARLAQLDDGNDCAFLVQGDEGSAQVIRLGHQGTPSVTYSDDGAISFAACPIPSLRWRKGEPSVSARGDRFLWSASVRLLPKRGETAVIRKRSARHRTEGDGRVEFRQQHLLSANKLSRLRRSVTLNGAPGRG